jgi:hypothetical protein
MPRTVILNQSNIVANTGNSVFEYQFPLGGISFKDELIAVQQISLYQSVFNITQANNNNKFAYQWVDGTITQVIIPDGYYELEDIMAYFRDVMTSNTHYLLNGDISYIYLLELVVNVSKYADQINSFQISAQIATDNGWTLPDGATWALPTNIICPIFIVQNNAFKNVIGYNAGNYPSGVISGVAPAQIQTPTYDSTQSFLSSSAPQIVPQPSYLCLCSLVNNRLCIPSQLIYSLTPSSSSFGTIYSIQISELAFNKIEDGNYTNLRFTFVDQLGNSIAFQDPNILILLIVKNKSELGYT